MIPFSLGLDFFTVCLCTISFLSVFHHRTWGALEYGLWIAAKLLQQQLARSKVLCFRHYEINRRPTSHPTLFESFRYNEYLQACNILQSELLSQIDISLCIPSGQCYFCTIFFVILFDRLNFLFQRNTGGLDFILFLIPCLKLIFLYGRRGAPEVFFVKMSTVRCTCGIWNCVFLYHLLDSYRSFFSCII
ncbi:hypothetical protein BDZ91DRAFT_506381 [Kalaharituber pfeilii]|nr:hypothetical protein BDZ91DRAFT_506381 [Kalaharituber pfeilii]